MKIKTSIAVLTGCLTIFFFLMLPVFLSMKEQKDQSVAAFKGSDFELKDMNNNSITQESFNGPLTAIFFGFTNCPDICPMTLNKMDIALNRIKKNKKKDFKVFFISVDPKRDTPRRMARYLSDYNPKIIGLTGKHSDLKKVWKNFFVHVLPANEVTAVDHAMDHSSEGEDHSGENYMVEHTAFYYLFNNKDELSAILPFGTSEEILLTEIKKIL